MLNKFDELRIKGDILSKVWDYLQDEYQRALIDVSDANDELSELTPDSYRYDACEKVANEYAYKATAIKQIMEKLDKLV